MKSSAGAVKARSGALDTLRGALGGAPAGPVAEHDSAHVERALAAAWDELELDGAGSEMAGYEVLGQTAAVTWDPPFLRFTVRRGMDVVLGVPGAAVQAWEVDVANGVATCELESLHPVAAPARGEWLDPLVEEIAAAVTSRVPHPALSWATPERVRVLTTRMRELDSPDGPAAAARRKRFVTALAQRVTPEGWMRLRTSNVITFQRSPG